MASISILLFDIVLVPARASAAAHELSGAYPGELGAKRGCAHMLTNGMGGRDGAQMPLFLWRLGRFEELVRKSAGQGPGLRSVV